MENEIRKDLESIIDYSHKFAKYMLNNGKEYYPFGAEIKNNGELVAIGQECDETDFPDSMKVINELKSRFEKQFLEGKIIAYGLTYDVKVQLNDLGEKSDAICIDITHRNSDDIPRYYFTYSWSENNELTFGESFGIKR